MRGRRVLLFFLSCFLFLLSAGCWDLKDIEKLSFVRGVGIDEQDENGVKLTYQNLVPKTGGTQEADSPGYVNVVSKGKNVLEAVSNVALKDPPIYSDHLKIFLFGKTQAEHHDIQGTLNHFIRDDEVRRSSYLLVSRGDASKVINQKLKSQQKVPVEHIFETSKNRSFNGKIALPTRIGRASDYFQMGISFLVQSVDAVDGELIYDGAGIIHGKTRKLIGFISAQDVQYLNWVMDRISGGVVPATYKGFPITYEIKKAKTKIEPYLKDGKVSFNVSVQTNGKLSEDQYPPENSYDEQYIKRFEKIFSHKIKERIQKTVSHMQHEVGVDPIFFSRQFRIKYPEYWDQHRDEWDKLFQEADITYDIKVSILNFGAEGATKSFKW
ncbi:Ger(x)C family spore germination protein [Bacillus safensis]|uniref:Ger(x)C family spore germination protein n=1 Tax=Bacillus TaxID=1386 RepID=UPI001B59F983|nr:Ger(x)C family spore germination protein [Bacillus safensis]MBK4213347.1 Ger(x)C family spore germination protein [Bacillus pumilus]MEC0983420.1 Ger(x)C family spore germination protein [Bacillus safensis]MEC1119693.1 Ger(x)C family spore germination protein [Bacillus safensis]MED0802881.1 Ger(x)C family spore germination protein [Bacillus safensis]